MKLKNKLTKFRVSTTYESSGWNQNKDCDSNQGTKVDLENFDIDSLKDFKSINNSNKLQNSLLEIRDNTWASTARNKKRIKIEKCDESSNLNHENIQQVDEQFSNTINFGHKTFYSEFQIK